ncbi:MAG: TIGR04282 family arsenosugar biosynthesis glycosyltransferase [Actinomycetota bacterium]|nr:TIGR04282 family arsenosugar biosynthesis glycosyltransferase [Actinomycetota bacterium]
MDKVSAQRPAIVIVAKLPIPGHVKTRLCPPLTPQEATALYTCFLQDTVAKAASLSIAEPFIALNTTELAAEPQALLDTLMLPGSVRVIDQGKGDLGARLSKILTDAFPEPAQVIFIGADSPSLPRPYLVHAVSSLERHDVVIGPSDDGGYYLIGLSSSHRCLFTDIAWSTSAVFEQTLARVAAAELKVDVLPGWFDVDDDAGLRRLRRELQDDPSSAPRTASYLADHSW